MGKQFCDSFLHSSVAHSFCPALTILLQAETMAFSKGGEHGSASVSVPLSGCPEPPPGEFYLPPTPLTCVDTDNVQQVPKRKTKYPLSIEDEGYKSETVCV